MIPAARVMRPTAGASWRTAKHDIDTGGCALGAIARTITPEPRSEFKHFRRGVRQFEFLHQFDNLPGVPAAVDDVGFEFQLLPFRLTATLRLPVPASTAIHPDGCPTRGLGD